jgi:hypothetical protein
MDADGCAVGFVVVTTDHLGGFRIFTLPSRRSKQPSQSAMEQLVLPHTLILAHTYGVADCKRLLRALLTYGALIGAVGCLHFTQLE